MGCGSFAFAANSELTTSGSPHSRERVQRPDCPHGAAGSPCDSNEDTAERSPNALFSARQLMFDFRRPEFIPSVGRPGAGGGGPREVEEARRRCIERPRRPTCARSAGRGSVPRLREADRRQDPRSLRFRPRPAGERGLVARQDDTPLTSGRAHVDVESERFGRPAHAHTGDERCDRVAPHRLGPVRRERAA